MNIFLNRRKKLLNKIKDGIIIIPSAELKQRSNDTEYPFRQNSNYFYLTGFKEQNSVLVLSKKGNEVKQIMFLEKKVPEMELWTGKRLGEKEAPRKLLVDEAYPIEEFQRRLELLLNGFKRIYISAFEQKKIQKIVDETCHQLWTSRKKQGHLPHEVIHLDYLIEEMRLVKEENEIQNIKKLQQKLLPTRISPAWQN